MYRFAKQENILSTAFYNFNHIVIYKTWKILEKNVIKIRYSIHKRVFQTNVHIIILLVLQKKFYRCRFCYYHFRLFPHHISNTEMFYSVKYHNVYAILNFFPFFLLRLLLSRYVTYVIGR